MNLQQRLRAFPVVLVVVAVAGALPSNIARAAQPGAEIVVAPEAGSQKRTAAVATDALGSSVVVWRSVESPAAGAAEAIFGQRYGSDGSPRGGVFRVSAAEVETAPSVAMDGQGNFFVVWAGPVRGITGNGHNIYGRRYSAAGVPASDEFVIDATAAGDGSRQVDVAMNPAGAAAVVWDDTRSLGTGGRAVPSLRSTAVRLQRYASSGARSGLTQIVASSVDYELPVANPLQTHQRDTVPRVAINGGSQIVVTWLHDDPIGAGTVYARRYALLGAALGAATQISSDSSLILGRDGLGRPTYYTTYEKSAPDVAIDDAGIATFTWLGAARISASEFSSGLYVRRYSGDGQPLGPETLLETSIPRQRTQSDPSVALDGAGHAVVVWIGIDLSPFGSTAFSVVAQRLDGNGTPAAPIVLSAVPGQRRAAPALAAFPGGRFLAIWATQPQVGNGTFGDVFGTVSLVRCCTP